MKYIILLISLFSHSVFAENDGFSKTDKISAPQFFESVSLEHKKEKSNLLKIGRQYHAYIKNSNKVFLLEYINSLFKDHKSNLSKNTSRKRLKFKKSDNITLGLDLNFDIGRILSEDTYIKAIDKIIVEKVDGVVPENNRYLYIVDFKSDGNYGKTGLNFLRLSENIFEGFISGKNNNISFYNNLSKDPAKISIIKKSRVK